MITDPRVILKQIETTFGKGYMTMAPVYKHVAVMVDNETGEIIGGMTAIKLDKPADADTLFVGDRVFDVTRVSAAAEIVLTTGATLYVYEARVTERFIMQQEYAASLTPEQRAVVNTKRARWAWLRNLLGGRTK